MGVLLRRTVVTVILLFVVAAVVLTIPGNAFSDENTKYSMHIKPIFDKVSEEVQKQSGVRVDCLYGTMIEITRACLTAGTRTHVARRRHPRAIGINGMV